MSNDFEFPSMEDRVEVLIEQEKARKAQEAKAKRANDRVIVLQEKEVVKSLSAEKNVVHERMKSFFKMGAAAGIAALGIATVAPVIAAVAAIGAGYLAVLGAKDLKEVNDITKDIKVAKHNVNTIIATLKGEKAKKKYEITKRIADCRRLLAIREMANIKKLPKP